MGKGSWEADAKGEGAVAGWVAVCDMLRQLEGVKFSCSRTIGALFPFFFFKEKVYCNH